MFVGYHHWSDLEETKAWRRFAARVQDDSEFHFDGSAQFLAARTQQRFDQGVERYLAQTNNRREIEDAGAIGADPHHDSIVLGLICGSDLGQGTIAFSLFQGVLGQILCLVDRIESRRFSHVDRPELRLSILEKLGGCERWVGVGILRAIGPGESAVNNRLPQPESQVNDAVLRLCVSESIEIE